MKIQDYSPECRTKAGSVVTAEAWLEEVTPRVRYNANFLTVFVDGTVREITNRICHADLGNGIQTKRDCFAFFTARYDDQGVLNNGYVSGYLDWLCSESFAAQFVLKRTRNGVVVTADVPPELLQNIAIMTRHCRELPAVTFDLFNYVVSKGYSGDVAYPLTFNTSRQTNRLEDELLAPVRCSGGGHRAWKLFTTAAYGRFVRGDFGLDPKATMARARATLYGGAKLCGMEDRARDSITFNHVFLELVKDADFVDALRSFRAASTKTEGYKPPNPFSIRPVATPSANELSFNEAIEVALPYLTTKGIFDVTAN